MLLSLLTHAALLLGVLTTAVTLVRSLLALEREWEERENRRQRRRVGSSRR
jgi:hypothetical protein